MNYLVPQRISIQRDFLLRQRNRDRIFVVESNCKRILFYAKLQRESRPISRLFSCTKKSLARCTLGVFSLCQNRTTLSFRKVVPIIPKRKRREDFKVFVGKQDCVESTSVIRAFLRFFHGVAPSTKIRLCWQGIFCALKKEIDISTRTSNNGLLCRIYGWTGSLEPLSRQFTLRNYLAAPFNLANLSNL